MQAADQANKDSRHEAPAAPQAPDADAAFVCRDLLPDIILPNHLRHRVQLSTEMHGKGLLLLLCPGLHLAKCVDQLRRFARFYAELEAFVHVYAVTRSAPDANAAVVSEEKLPFAALSDTEGQVARGLSVGHNLSQERSADGEGAFTAIFADANRRITRIDRDIRDTGYAQQALAYLRGLPQRKPRRLDHFAPILYVPQVLEPELCRELIAAFEAGSPERGTVFRHEGEIDKGSYAVDAEAKVRRDLYIDDPVLKGRIKRAFARRIAPEIKKAFTRDIVGVEDFKVACYDAAEGGKFRPHRDNVSEWHAHRRYAMTLNLNTEEYEGGALRFPEYGPDLYAPDSGDAVIFSCSLMHEATPVTKGRRFVLLSFMFDEESRKLNARFSRKPAPPA